MMLRPQASQKNFAIFFFFNFSFTTTILLCSKVGCAHAHLQVTPGLVQRTLRPFVADEKSKYNNGCERNGE